MTTYIVGADNKTMTNNWYEQPGLFAMRRREFGIKQSELAARAGVTQALISQLENGVTGWTEDTAGKVMDAYAELAGEKTKIKTEQFMKSPEYAKQKEEEIKKYGPMGKPLWVTLIELSGFDPATGKDVARDKALDLIEQLIADNRKWYDAFIKAMQTCDQLIADKTGATAAEVVRMQDEIKFLRDLLVKKTDHALLEKDIEEMLAKYKKDHP